MLQEQVRNSISSEHKGSRGSNVHSLEIRNANTGFPFSDNRGDIFDCLEGENPAVPQINNQITDLRNESLTGEVRVGGGYLDNGENQTNNQSAYLRFAEVPGVLGVVKVGNRVLGIPASNPDSPSAVPMSAPLNRTSQGKSIE
ncbi:MAG: hypothetical protein RL769_155, partial [Pseudomonadota bacterium]|jgi:hypothetical protein